MGLDLKVMASHFRDRRGEVLPTATLRFDRDETLFAQLTSDAVPCRVHPLPSDLVVGCYEDSGLRYSETDSRGKRLTYTTSADLRGLLIPPDTAPWNVAIITFLLALPPDHRIYLYWC